MKGDSRPHLIQDGKPSVRLKRVELGGRTIREDFLQDLLHRNPSILPVSKFDESFGPLVAVGREIMGIDNLFVSPTGRLTVVETKLWRNPQATRHVLAQILDYANRLSSLDIEALEQRCRSANQSAVSESRSLFDLVCQAFPDQAPSESEFTDRLQKSLSTGRFLLLVVGDGIREGLEGVLDSLHHQSRLHFTFGLVEMKLYRTPPDDALLVVPSVVAHSTEIERAVVTIRGAQPDQVEVSVRSDPGEKAPRLTESEFLESIQDAEVRQFGERLFDWGRQRGWIEITKNGASASIRIPFTATRAGFILLRLFKSGKVYTTPPRLRRVLRRIGIGEQEVVRLARELQQLVPEIQIDEQSEMVARSIPARLLSVHLDEVLEVYDAAIQRFKALDPGVENPEDEIETDEDS
jgi:hypothetical protein